MISPLNIISPQASTGVGPHSHPRPTRLPVPGLCPALFGAGQRRRSPSARALARGLLRSYQGSLAGDLLGEHVSLCQPQFQRLLGS